MEVTIQLSYLGGPALYESIESMENMEVFIVFFMGKPMGKYGNV